MKECREDYRILVKIQNDKSCVDDVLCKIYLPKRLTEPIELYLYANEEQRRKLDGIFEFSIVGELKGFSGKIEARIKVDKAYFKSSSKVHWGPDITECIFTAEPIDLKITEFFHRDINGSSQKTVGSFWLTPSSLLSPVKTIDRSSNGNVKVETIRQFKFTLDNGLPLIFDTCLSSFENEDGDDVTFSELVARFEIEAGGQDFKNIENDVIAFLDDFLMLVSFAERHRCVCLGWDFINSEGRTKFYRRNLVIPDVKKKPSRLNALIDIQDFEEFIKQAYSKFIKIEQEDLIRKAIQHSIYREDETLESRFLVLYSALETLVLYFRRIQQLEAVFTPAEWNHFQEELKKWLKKCPPLSNDKNKRVLIYEKIPELNRISFSTAFNYLCNFHSVDLSDLWPVLKNNNGISLAEIRNKLTHGEYFDPLQSRALIAAKEHLQWIMERLTLSLLDWPISRSYVNKDFLSRNMACYKEWKEDQKILSV